MENKTETSFSALSKKVGFNMRPQPFPKNMLEVKKASPEQILIWFRFCPTAKNHKQIELINEISKRFKMISKD